MKALSGLSIHTKIFCGWGLCIFGGLYSFVLSKRYITSRRYESMKARERMKNAQIDEVKPGELRERKIVW